MWSRLQKLIIFQKSLNNEGLFCLYQNFSYLCVMEKKNTLYIYTTESDRKLGRYKFGQTKREANQRVKEQDGTSNSEPLEKIYSIESNLSDHQVHEMLELKGKKRTRSNREFYETFDGDDDAIYYLNLIISEDEEDTRPTYVPRFYQDVVKMMFEDKLSKLDSSKKEFALELAPRFGKTIFTIDLIDTLFNDYGYKICFLPAYVLTALSSFKKEFYNFNGYSDKMVYVSDINNIKDVINQHYGKKMIVVEISLHTEDYENKLSAVKSIPQNEKCSFIDESDFGTHRFKSQEFIKYLECNLDVYMTGTAIEKIVSVLDNIGDNIICWSYTDMLMVQEGVHPLQEELV